MTFTLLKNGRILAAGSEIELKRASSADHYSWILVNTTTGCIEDVGTNDAEPLLNQLPEGSEVVDLNGKTVLPGLQDAHIHLYLTGRAVAQLNLKGTTSIEDMQRKLRIYVEDFKRNASSKETEGMWILGAGWEQDNMNLPPNQLPTRHDLDAVVSDFPVVLFRACYHIGVLNTKALQLIKLIDTNEPAAIEYGGEVDRDEKGLPTGILREYAMNLLNPFLDNLPKAIQKHYIELGLKACVEFGLTAVQSNDCWAWDIYKELADEGKLPLRVFLTIMQYEAEYQELSRSDASYKAKLLASVPKAGESYGPLLSCDRVKLYSDGSLGAATAALRLPYAGDDSENRGMLTETPEDILQKVEIAHRLGYHLEIHAIGDGAAELVISTFEKLGITDSKSRPMLTHCQILGSDLIERMKAANVIANVQPSFVGTDSHWVEKRLGLPMPRKSAAENAALADRLACAYAWKTLLKQGIHVAGGSDAPIETCNPLEGMWSAIFRYKSTDNVRESTTTWMPQECLTFAEALHIYTDGAAYAVSKENCLGKIEKNFKCDLTILDRSSLDQSLIWEQPEHLISQRIYQVWVDGKKTFERKYGGDISVTQMNMALCQCHRKRG